MVNDVYASGKKRNVDQSMLSYPQYFSKVDPNACLDQFVEYAKLRKNKQKYS